MVRQAEPAEIEAGLLELAGLLEEGIKTSNPLHGNMILLRPTGECLACASGAILLGFFGGAVAAVDWYRDNHKDDIIDVTLMNILFPMFPEFRVALPTKFIADESAGYMPVFTWMVTFNDMVGEKLAAGDDVRPKIVAAIRQAVEEKSYRYRTNS